MAIKYFHPVVIVDYNDETATAHIARVDGNTFPCGLSIIRRSISSLTEDTCGEIQKAIQELANKQVGG